VCARSLRRGNRSDAAPHHVRPPRRPLHARPRHLKRHIRRARSQPQLWAFNGLVPYRVSVTPARPKPRARKTRPSKGTITDQWSQVPLGKSGRHRCPRISRITDQQLEGRLGREPTNPADVRMMGAPSRHPAMALLIRGSKPNPQRVRASAPDRQSQGQSGHAYSSLSSSPPARGRPTCHVQEPTRAASRGIQSRESFRALGPHRTRPSPT
jgi:hypothetical protein